MAIRRTTRKPAPPRAAKTPTKVNLQNATSAPSVSNRTILPYAEQQMHTYAIEVITDRAIPDVVDGLKPVQRRILFAASQVTSQSNRMVKTARLVGTVLGIYHPHGDQSVVDAIFTMVTKHPTPMLKGEGNWGSLVDSAAAERYTNVGLSNYGWQFVHPDYINKHVTRFVPNYDDRDVEPLILPAPLPNVLMTEASGIAVGAATSLPAFTPQSLIAVVRLLLKGQKLEDKDYAKLLKPIFRYGGALVLSPKNKQQWLQLFNSTRSRIEYESRMKVDESRRQIIISEWPPGLMPDAVDAAIRKMAEVKIWVSEGAHTFTVEMKKGYNLPQFHAVVERIGKILRSAVSYNLNVTQTFMREAEDGSIQHKRKLFAMTVPQMIQTWLRARIEFEKRSLQYKLTKAKEALDYTDLILYATTILDEIRAAQDAPDFTKYLVKHTKLTEEQAGIVGGFTVRSLSKLDRAKYLERKKQQMAEMQQLKTWLAKPSTKVALDIDEIEKIVNTKDKEVALKIA